MIRAIARNTVPPSINLHQQQAPSSPPGRERTLPRYHPAWRVWPSALPALACGARDDRARGAHAAAM